MKNNIAFVLGNGTSRQAISLDSLKENGIVYGCNALYREFTPHHLVAVNPEMIFEINKAKYKGATYFENPHGWSSGPTALWLASNIGHTTIYILGFDFTGLNGKINNIYAGTPNYLDTDSEEVYYGNWLKHTAEVIEEFPQIDYIRIKNNNYNPEKLSILSNYNEEEISMFAKRINLANDIGQIHQVLRTKKVFN